LCCAGGVIVASALVELVGLRKVYGETVAVERFDLEVAVGEFVVLLGPSGSGKTTVLSLLGGFTAPTEGGVRIEGEDVTALPPARRPTATVFQDYALFPHMSVAGNVGFGLRMRRVPRAEARRRVEASLALVGLGGFGARAIHELSGGQRQRVALARAIAVEPKVLLLDEPLGALDMALRRQMQEELVHIQKRLGTTFVHVTHDQQEAMAIADRIVVVHDGRIEDAGAPERVYLRPATLFTAGFMGESNLIAGRVSTTSAGRARVETALGALEVPGTGRAGDSVCLCLRPRQLRIRADGGEDNLALGPARVAEVLFQGTHLRVHARAENVEGTALLLHLPVEERVATGDAIEVHARAGDAVLLPRV
jgi:spermidine/putrescine transport system ATP-binding protein